ncbi:MAG: hypothetical protein ACTHN8_17665 [Angustibacter sp.]
MSTLAIPARFNGPPRSGNGGWTCGALAQHIVAGEGEAVQVRLMAPPPLDTDLVVTGDERQATASDGDRVVATASVVPSPFAAPAPEPVPWDVAAAAESAYRGLHDHPFPTCFSCGTGRPASDGLGLRPGPLADRPEVTACTWVPADDVAGPEGRVTAEVTWAALDCPGGWSVDLAGRPMVLGTMTARVDALPRAGVRHVVMGRVQRQEGRKAWTETALYALAPAPRLLARASAVWIAVDPTAIQP